MLMHLARGAGLRGLAAMAPAREGPGSVTWIRPLLDLTRGETRTLVELLEVPFIDDPSNEDRKQLRVRVRHEVLPVLRERNPEVERTMAATARDVADARRFLEEEIHRELQARRRKDGSFDVSGLARRPRALRVGFLRAACLETLGDEDALARRVVRDMDRALDAAAAAGGAPRGWDLRGVRVVLEQGSLRCLPASSDSPDLPNH
jgi:tRNA(Ile)-lysidine synthase